MQYALTEIGDETRNSVMFARWALGKLFRLVAPTGPSMWAGTLVAEEARHVRFAREELVREMGHAHWGPKRCFHRVFAAAAAAFIARGLISPNVYDAVGLDAKAARKAALANPNYRDTTLWMGEKIVPFLEEVGMTNRTARAIYRYANLMA